jgi:hypothetical protein
MKGGANEERNGFFGALTSEVKTKLLEKKN